MELKSFSISRYSSTAKFTDSDYFEVPANVDEAKLHMSDDEKEVLDQILEMKTSIGAGFIYPQLGVRTVTHKDGVTTIDMFWKYR